MDLLATFTCKDTSGIVHTMTDAVLKCNGNIIENQQFTDPITGLFCMRTRFTTETSLKDSETILRNQLATFSPELKVREFTKRPRALILVTKESHCLRDLLFLNPLTSFSNAPVSYFLKTFLFNYFSVLFTNLFIHEFVYEFHCPTAPVFHCFIVLCLIVSLSKNLTIPI